MGWAFLSDSIHRGASNLTGRSRCGGRTTQARQTQKADNRYLRPIGLHPRPWLRCSLSLASICCTVPDSRRKRAVPALPTRAKCMARPCGTRWTSWINEREIAWLSCLGSCDPRSTPASVPVPVAPKSRPCLKPAPLPTAATTALEMTGPTPAQSSPAVVAIVPPEEWLEDCAEIKRTSGPSLAADVMSSSAGSQAAWNVGKPTLKLMERAFHL